MAEAALNITGTTEDPEALGGILNSEMEAETQQPAVTSILQQAPFLYGALAIVLALLVGIIFGSRHKKKKEESLQEKEKKSQEKKESKTSITAVEKEEKAPLPVAVAKVHGQGAREDQQDSFGVSDITDTGSFSQRGLLAVVADGMGGLSNGGAVSSLLVRTCHNSFYAQPRHVSPPDMLVEMVIRSNEAVNQMLQGSTRSGSTLVSAIVRDSYLYFLTVGDSRIYLFRGGALIQLNREHIYREEIVLDAVNKKTDAGRIHQDPQAKSLTSYLGIGKITHLDRNQEGIRLINKDKILLASDGVFGTLTPEQLERALALPAEEAAEQIRTLVQEANRPYQDNYTALILEYHG